MSRIIVTLKGGCVCSPGGGIFNATLRENITFGLPFIQEKYDRVVSAASLVRDIEIMGESGDMTEIGEGGVNLSGGQKQRLSIARALYADADVYLR